MAKAKLPVSKIKGEPPSRKVTVTELKGQRPRVGIILEQTVQIRDYNPAMVNVWASHDVEEGETITSTINKLDKELSPIMAKKVQPLMLARSKENPKK